MIIYCPYCKSVAIKGFEELKDNYIKVSFIVRCAKCQKNLEIEIGYQRAVIVDTKITTNLGEVKARLIGGDA